MKQRVLLALLVALVCVHAAPVDQDGLEQASCDQPSVVSAARLALTKINQDRTEGYVFDMHRLSNAHIKPHGELGMVYYLTLDVVETNCSVLSRKEPKDCEIRPTHNTPVYGQCKAAIYISKIHRVVRLYKYNCAIRPVPAGRIADTCPDCPSLVGFDEESVQKVVHKSLEKFNKESGLANYFTLAKIARAVSGMAMGMYYHVEYTIQETTCPRTADIVTKCPIMDCEFAHKGFCKGSMYPTPTGEEDVSVECEIYEPEAAEREKKAHLLGGGTDHDHKDNQDPPLAADAAHTHDHVHDHTKTHAEHTQHNDNSDHHHTHDHGTHRHAHAHSHDHGHGHDHVHAHHAKAHDHSHDSPNHHHNYKHADGVHTHEHDHELALDHDHKHAHLHEHEHHHHHHDHEHETVFHDNPEGEVKVLPALGRPLPVLPAAPAQPEVGVVLPLIPDPQIPGETQPVILSFPTSLSARCPRPTIRKNLVDQMFAEDPLFKPTA